ncbi:hypothetical protein HYE67_003115 [Fusarium culmorum]|uniref:SNF2 N-terminal domain-containing protein n=1 Tax=Fusarium culmorum TaxID=5516 RepID=A0A7S8D2N8_FUSCU|nr:hypothetical protein HYE67_003115 [Fusarium culmorum]
MSEGLGGLDSVDVNTSLLELVQPSRIPAHQNAEASALQDMEPISAANFAAEIRLLKRLHKQPDFDAILERRRKTITNVTDFIEDSDIDEFINRQSASELVSEFAREHPDDIDELMNLSRQQYALEHVLSSIQPVTNLDLDQLCDDHSIAPWPELKLYTGDRATAIQGLKPHQVDDAAAIVARGFADYKHTFLSNDMGTGKTKTCFTAIELTHRKKLKQYQSGMEQYGKSDVKFHPTLIFTAVNSIFQTWKEGKDHFPTMNLYVYYGTSSSDFPDTKAKVINTGDFKDELNASSVADSNPETGLIVIISTYPTWSGRNVLKLERPFVFKAGKRPVSRQKDARLIENDSDEEVDIELLNNLPKYHVSEITRDNIRFLTEDTASAAEKPDGCLIEYISRQSALDSIVFEHVIADDAHLAKKPNGVYNHMLQLINWNKLLWVTGTPILSSLQDLISPLSLIWNAYNIAIDSPGLYDETYDPYQAKNVFQKGTTVGIFHEDFLAECSDWKPLMDIYEASGRTCKLWIVNPTIFKHAGKTLEWGTNAGHLVVS